MSCNVNAKELVLPLRSQTLFKYEQGTKLRITTYDGRIFEGYAHRNTKGSRNCTKLEVSNATKLGLVGKRAEQGFLRFEAAEIDRVQVLGDPTEWNNKMGGFPQQMEVIYQTLMITTEAQLYKLLAKLKETKEVGLNLYGIFVGRFGQVGWITLFLEDTLICVDVLTLANEVNNFWDLMGLHLFENEAIEKIVYNSKPIADYLYHKHSIELKNVFDLQVAQFFNWCKGKPRDGLVKSRDKLEYKKLSDILAQFLPDDVIPEELELLREFELRDFSKESPLMERPLLQAEKKVCKCVAIEMKYLLRLKKLFQKLLMSKFYDCVTSQMTEIAAGNNAVSEMFVRLPYRIPGEVFKTVVSPGYRGSGCVDVDGASPPDPEQQDDDGSVGGSSTSTDKY